MSETLRLRDVGSPCGLPPLFSVGTCGRLKENPSAEVSARGHTSASTLLPFQLPSPPSPDGPGRRCELPEQTPETESRGDRGTRTPANTGGPNRKYSGRF